jgi:uncharacterized repeat protein (TIGR01451 family)
MVAASVLVAGMGLLVGSNAALASGGGGPTPPWYPVTPAPNGSITFYNAWGQVVTGGSITASGLGAFAAASTPPGTPGYDKATLFVFTPVNGFTPNQWSGEQISNSTTYPNTAAPGQLGTTTNPVETNSGSDTSLSNYIAALPNTSTATGYVGLYDVRLEVSGTSGTLATYWNTVISVNTSSNTWSIDYPDWTENTTTSLSASPPTPQTAPASPVTLTATVAPASAGTVTFWGGSAQVGAIQSVTATNGVASVSVTPPTGTTAYQAVFTPTIGSADIGSASSTLSYVVVVPPVLTLTKTADAPYAIAGNNIGFTNTVTNTDPTLSATNVVLSDPLPSTPAGIGPWTVSSSIGFDACSISSLVLTCTAASIAAGASSTVHVTASTSATTSGMATNTATITSTNGNCTAGSTDPNCSSTATVTITPAHVEVVKTANPIGPVTAGNHIGFDTTVNNDGTVVATGVSLNDPLPSTPAGIGTWTIASGPVASGGSPTPTCSISSDTLTCSAIDVPVGGSYTLRVTAPTSATTSGTATNTATITSTNGNCTAGSTDPNCSSTATVTITPPTRDPTSTAVSCTPNPVVESTPTRCTATVTDTAATGATSPEGTVTFTTSGPGTFASPKCTLAATTTPGVSNCSAIFTPMNRKNKTQTITGSYGGESSHKASHANTLLKIAGVP